jgi:5-methyltetrahydropteroyltriglutamate--homocysteine methyltransferase
MVANRWPRREQADRPKVAGRVVDVPDGRIFTTHVGSLPRPQDVVDLVQAEDRSEAVDRAEYDRVMMAAVQDRVRRQIDAGVDLVSDGEMSKIGYATYIRHRLSGFELGDVPRATPADLDAYPAFRDRLANSGATARYLRPICRGPIVYEHRAPLEQDLARLTKALSEAPGEGAFMNSPSPGIIALFQPNEYYPNLDEYLAAVSAAMKVEYDSIVDAGFTLQIDAPDLAMGRHIMYRDRSDEEFVTAARRNVEVLNDALRDVPPERVRLAIWANAKIPEDKVLAPGVIDTTTNFIEHPELVAERICRYAEIVGRDRVLAATDCGFGTWSGFGAIDPDICWAKLRSLAEGTSIANKRLF